MCKIFLFFALQTNPEICVEEYVDLVTLNYVYNEEGELNFAQLIFWDWDGSRYQVVDWRMYKREEQYPIREKSIWVLRWYDEGILRKVISNHFTTTWTQYDAEIMEQETLPSIKRRKLRRK